MKKKWLTAFIIYAALLIVCLVVIYAVPSIRGLLEKTYITEVGTVEIKDEVSGYIVRDETVYVAAQDSKINRLAEANRLVKSGAAVVELTSTEEKSESEEDQEAEKEDAKLSRKYASVIEELGDNFKTTRRGKCGEAGFVCYSLDGQEARLSTSKIDNLEEKDFEALSKKKSVEMPAKRCSKGEPVFKIVDNKKWYLVLFIDNELAARYQEGRTIYMDAAGEQVPVRVAFINEGKSRSEIVLTCKVFFDGFMDMRTMDTTLTIASAQGLVIQDRSIFEKDGQKGVLIKNKLGEHKFRPISIKADDGEKCVVYSDIYVDEGGNFVETVSAYDEIIAEPSEEEIASLNSGGDTGDNSDSNK